MEGCRQTAFEGHMVDAQETVDGFIDDLRFWAETAGGQLPDWANFCRLPRFTWTPESHLGVEGVEEGPVLPHSPSQPLSTHGEELPEAQAVAPVGEQPVASGQTPPPEEEGAPNTTTEDTTMETNQNEGSEV